MKKLLPKISTSSQSKSSGFTLIELMVVISIIAILAVVGITVFSGVQKGARDARRKVDIDAIANAMEVHFGQCQVGNYCPFVDAWFSSGTTPTDPFNGQYKCSSDNAHVCAYCIGGLNVLPSTTSDYAHNGCGPLTDQSYWVWPVAAGNPGTTVGTGGRPYQDTVVICANLESSVNGKGFYCKRSQQ